MPNEEHDTEPVILPFRLPRKAEPIPDIRQAEAEIADADEEQKEAFWAGRNHAMRRSARVAA
jgi:hypothetical protein